MQSLNNTAIEPGIPCFILSRLDDRSFQNNLTCAKQKSNLRNTNFSDIVTIFPDSTQ